MKLPVEKQGREGDASLASVFVNPSVASFRLCVVTLLNLIVEVAAIALLPLVDNGDTTPSCVSVAVAEATDDGYVR